MASIRTSNNLYEKVEEEEKRPQVAVLYDYEYTDDIDNSKVWMKTDEIFDLINEDGDEWWQVCRPDKPNSPFYVPSTYVEILKDGRRNSIDLDTLEKPGKNDNDNNLNEHNMDFTPTHENNNKVLRTFTGEMNLDTNCNQETNNARANRPSYIDTGGDYVNLDELRAAANMPALYPQSQTPPSPQSPESDYANLQQMNLTEPIPPEVESCKYERPLTEAWDVYLDPATNRMVYVHKETKETQWKPPKGSFHNENLKKKKSGGSTPTKSPSSSDSSDQPDPFIAANQSQLLGQRSDSKSKVSRFAKTRSVMIDNLHFNAPPVNTGPPPPKSATLPKATTVPSNLNDELRDFEPIEGKVNKCELINGKKMKKWAYSYAKLCGSNLVFYKDQKSSMPKPGNPHGKFDQMLPLSMCSLENNPKDYTSKKNTLLISGPDNQILLQADDDIKISEWFMKLHTKIKDLGGTPDIVQEPTTPATSSPSLVVEDSKVSRKPSLRDRHKRNPSDVGSLERKEKGKIREALTKFMSNRSDKKDLVKKGIYKDAVFGSDIKQLCEKEKSKVPNFVARSITAIEKRGLEHEGMYRIGGNISQIQKLRCEVDQGDSYDLDDPMLDINVLTGALKLFFRELKEPLFTYPLFDKFLKGFLKESASERLKAIKATLTEMPKCHYETVKLLFKHLTKVTDHRENKMEAHQLAIVFGPTLIWPEIQSQNLATSMVYQSRIVEYILLEYKTIFR